MSEDIKNQSYRGKMIEIVKKDIEKEVYTGSSEKAREIIKFGYLLLAGDYDPAVTDFEKFLELQSSINKQ